MQRRTFVFGGLAALATVPSIVTAKAYALPPPRLCLYHTHTNECLEIEYGHGESLTKFSLQKLNYFLRDFRTGQVKAHPPTIV